MRGAWLLVCAAVLPHSAYIVATHLGPAAVGALLLLGPSAIAGALFLAAHVRPPDRAAMAATAAIAALLAAVFLLDYPRENLHLGALGMDRDDALEIATRALLRGEFPYREATYLGSPITPLPGALLLSAPLVAIGGTVYGNLFWLGILAALLARASSWWTAALLIGVTGFAPGPLHSLLHGNDFTANAVAVLTGFTLALEWTGRRRIAALALLGVALSWRVGFLFVLPPLAAALARREGLRTAAPLVAVPVATCAVVTLPFALYDWHAFSPAHVASTFGASAAAGVGLLFAIAFAGWSAARARSTASVLLGAFLSIWAPPLIVAAGAARWPWLEYSGLALPFALAAAASRVPGQVAKMEQLARDPAITRAAA